MSRLLVKANPNPTPRSLSNPITTTSIETITPDIIQLFKKRVYDIAAVTEKSVKVSWNSTLVPVKEFQDYIDSTSKTNVLTNSRMNVGSMLSHYKHGEYNQVSLNGIYTAKGGNILIIFESNYKKVIAVILEKRKIEVKPAVIKEQLIICQV